MKSIKTIQELWSYCLFCPICQDMTREIHVGIGPDEAFELFEFEKNNHILTLKCGFYCKDKMRSIKYDINCLNNSFDMDITESVISSRNVSGAKSSYPYFWLNGNCRVCNASHISSGDVELNVLNKIASNLTLEMEGLSLIKEKDKYYIFIEHSHNTMQISKCFEDENGDIIDENNPFKYPIINFDYSNPKKVLNKIKMLLVFS